MQLYYFCLRRQSYHVVSHFYELALKASSINSNPLAIGFRDDLNLVIRYLESYEYLAVTFIALSSSLQCL